MAVQHNEICIWDIHTVAMYTGMSILIYSAGQMSVGFRISKESKKKKSCV